MAVIVWGTPEIDEPGLVPCIKEPIRNQLTYHANYAVEKTTEGLRYRCTDCGAEFLDKREWN